MHQFTLLLMIVGIIFFRERECKNEKKNFFPGTEPESRKVATRTLTIMYVSLVTTIDQNLSRLLVDLIQVSRAVLRYF